MGVYIILVLYFFPRLNLLRLRVGMVEILLPIFLAVYERLKNAYNKCHFVHKCLNKCIYKWKEAQVYK